MFFTFILCVGTHVTEHMWRLVNNLWELVLFFHYRDLRAGDQTEVVKRGSQLLHLLSHLAGRSSGLLRTL